MDFALNHEQEQLRDLAQKILADHITQERLRAVESGTEWFDRETWSALARANLVGLAFSEDSGGSGLSLFEAGLVLEQIGRRVAPVPYLTTVVMGGLPIDRFGSAEQKSRLLLPVATGDTVLTAALIEPAGDDGAALATTARKDGAAWRLDGVKTSVPAAHVAERVLVPATTGKGAVGMFVVDPHAKGVELQRQKGTSGERLSLMVLKDVAVDASDVLGDPQNGREILDWTVERTLAGLCMTELGVAAEALRMTAEYTSKREQFGKPVGSFQAVGQRAADAFIDVEAIRMTAYQAIWRLAQGLPSSEEVRIAKFWAAEGGHRVTYAAQHLHGGIGVDVDYPLHRYYVWSKQIELTLGSAHPQLVKLGALLAARQG
ncbi:acyl-CoA/acyl-ACP dehydrogenase [Candidatus Binatia bacterium]|nr:acyl-CoA/acyl-ACP dehydrogenase [Candidatus Binatia bacterium]